MARRMGISWLLLALLSAAIVVSARPPQVYVSRLAGCTYFFGFGLSGPICN